MTSGTPPQGGRRRQPDPRAASRADARLEARLEAGDPADQEMSDTRRSRRSASALTQALNTRPRGRHAEGPRSGPARTEQPDQGS